MNQSDLIAAGLIISMMVGAASLVGYGIYEQIQDAKATYIMIRKDSLERIIKQPCVLGTMTYTGNYILCKRRADYEPREARYWPSPYPERS